MARFRACHVRKHAASHAPFPLPSTGSSGKAASDRPDTDSVMEPLKAPAPSPCMERFHLATPQRSTLDPATSLTLTPPPSILASRRAWGGSGGNPEPYILIPLLYTPHPKPQTINPKPHYPNPNPLTLNTEPPTLYQKFSIPNPGP